MKNSDFGKYIDIFGAVCYTECNGGYGNDRKKELFGKAGRLEGRKGY